MVEKTTTQTTVPTTQPQQQPGLLGSLSPIAIMIVLFYFLIMRPQQKRETKRRELIGSVKRGDKIVTTSGIIGIFHKAINEKEISLDIAENVRVRMLKESIANVLEKGGDLGLEEIEDSEAGRKPSKKGGSSKK
ncbi:MAG: preprotein translocase subunit YajC [Holosporaceae bacterium]|jgi:preprotein translocase subunit YajC|nr:preprotein translocase subunit YajC [Holosporaceae bacterium]